MKKWGFLLAVFITSTLYGAELTVPDMYATIQLAINNALSGDTVIVSPGFYEENLNLGSKSIILTSIDPSDPNVVANTVIDGGDSGSVITCNGVDTTCMIAGFWIQNGNTASNGGGISSMNSDLTIKNCVFSSNTAGNFGGGIFSWSGAPTITNCRFIGNFCDGFGGGIGCYQSPAVVLNCEFSGNDGYYGGGITCYESDMVIKNCTMADNLTRSGSTGGYGGAIYFDDDGPGTANTPAVTNCILWNNSATHGNEIYINPGKIIDPTLSYNDISGCGGSGDDWGSSFGNDGGGNIDTDPNIIDADGVDNMAGTIDDDLHLDPYSVCINAGDLNAIYTGQMDMDYAARVRYGRVDMGADEVVDTNKCKDLGEHIREISHGGVDLALEAIGAPRTIYQAFTCLGPAGRLIVMGYTRNDVRFPAPKLVFEERSIHGVLGCPIHQYEEIFKHLLDGEYDLAKLVTKELPLDEIEQALNSVRSGQTIRTIIVP